jgi:hypothetical protein
LEIEKYSLGVKYKTIYVVYYDPIKKENQKLEILEDQISEYKAILDKKNIPYSLYVLTTKLEEYRPESKAKSMDFDI